MLGDKIADALSQLGIESERIERWLGRPCGCKERQEKLNQVEALAKRIIKGKVDNVLAYIESLLGQK